VGKKKLEHNAICNYVLHNGICILIHVGPLLSSYQLSLSVIKGRGKIEIAK